VVRARAVAADPQGVPDRRGRDDHRDPRQPDREAVEADRVRDPEALDPLPRGAELEPAVVEVEARGGHDPEADLHERDEERQPGRRRARQREHSDDERADEREEDEEGGQHGLAHRHEDDDEDGDGKGDREGVATEQP
jgi:hypothetical protein